MFVCGYDEGPSGTESDARSCVKVEVAVFNKPHENVDEKRTTLKPNGGEHLGIPSPFLISIDIITLKKKKKKKSRGD